MGQHYYVYAGTRILSVQVVYLSLETVESIEYRVGRAYVVVLGYEYDSGVRHTVFLCDLP